MIKISRGARVTMRMRATDDNGAGINALLGVPDDESFSFVQGEGRLPPPLELALHGLLAGERARIELPPENAFGPHRPELVFEAVRSNLPEDTELVPGTPLYANGGEHGVFHLMVVELTGNGAILDGNHPLAGKTLHFDVEVLEVEAAA